jgi:hypothetical protein
MASVSPKTLAEPQSKDLAPLPRKHPPPQSVILSEVPLCGTQPKDLASLPG